MWVSLGLGVSGLGWQRGQDGLAWVGGVGQGVGPVRSGGRKKNKMRWSVGRRQSVGWRRWLIEVWVDGNGSVAAGLAQIGVEEERSRWRGSEERHTEKQMKRRKKKNKNKRKN